MQDHPPSSDADEQPPSPDASVTHGDSGDARKSDQPAERLARDADAEPRQVKVTATVRRRNAPKLAQTEGGRDRTEPAAADVPALGAVEHPRATGARSGSLTWPLISLIGLLLVVFINWLANWLPLNNQTTGEVSRENPVPLQPAGWAFLIWALIYVLLFAFVIYSFLPVGQRTSRIRVVGPIFLVANIANITWIFFWHWEQFAASLVAIVVLLGSLALIYAVLRRRGADASSVSAMHRLLVRVPFSIYFGWVSIATIASLEVWMANNGWSGGPFGLRGWTVIFLIAGVLVASVFAFAAKDAAYPLVFVWGYSAIAYEQWDRSSLVSIVAGTLAIVAAAVTVMAFLRSFRGPAGSATPRHGGKPPVTS